MALTNETIRGNAELASLSDQQVNALVEMSKNDENDVIGRRLGEVYRGMDETIATATGVQRNGDEKTYNYLKRATSELKQKAEGAAAFTSEIQTLKAEKERLEGIVAKGGNNEEIQKQLAQAKADLTNVQTQYASLKKESEKQKTDFENKLFGVQVDNELKASVSGLKFKTELPEAATKVLLQQALDKAKTMHPRFIDDGKGGKVLAFHNEDGSVLRNSATNLQPFTATELIERELSSYGALAPKAGGGSGTQPQGQGGGSGSNVTVDVSAARTQEEYIDIASKALMSQGYTKASKEFTEALQEMLKADANYLKLPLK